MQARTNDIISRLQQEILPLGGFKTLRTDSPVSIGFRGIEQAFPNQVFPIGCVHEFLCGQEEELAATSGFVSGLASRFLNTGGVGLWVSHKRMVFPPALRRFNVSPGQIIFIDLKRQRDCLYALEDALKCHSISLVVGELQQISFKESRRLQLAAEQSRVTAFLLRRPSPVQNTIASVSRWRIRPLASHLPEGLPGVGFPRWQVELLRVRNGTPAQWALEWVVDAFTEVQQPAVAPQEERKVS